MGNNISEHAYFYQLKNSWSKYLSTRNSLIELLSTLILIVSVLIFFTHFINIIESRNGVELNDPILRLFKPVGLSSFIFGIIYFSIIAGLISLSDHPGRLAFALQVYSFLIVIRILTLYLMPLNSPPNMIPLIDPIVQIFGTGKLLTKDLFFSGHTATMFFLFLISRNRKLKIVFFFGFIIIAFALLLQHVHYTIDVAAAPFFTYAAYKIVLSIRVKINLNFTS